VKAMTFNEIFEEVSHLGFDTELEEYKAQFIDAMNRGFRAVTRRRPRVSSIRFELESSKRSEKGMFALDVKYTIMGDVGGAYERLPENPVRTEDGQLYRTDRYALLNKDTILFLPEAENGTYIIDFIMKSPKFDLDSFDDEDDIDLPEDLCDALVLFVSYYVLLDDNAELAGTYFARYNEAMVEILRTQPTHTPNGYQITKRW
jgi:hypothetical protein